MTIQEISIAKVFAASAFFAAIVIFPPWEIWRGSDFSDIENYVNRFERIASFGVQNYDLSGAITSLISQEYLWALLLNTSAEMGIDHELLFDGIGLLSSSVAFFFVARKLGALSTFVLMLNPLSIDLYNSQLRSALAFTLVLIACMLWSRGRYSKVSAAVLMFFAPFVHTSMLLVIFLGAFAVLVAKINGFPGRFKSLISLVGAVTAAIAFVYFGNLALSAIGDRRVLSDAGTRSATFLIFWALSALIFTCQRSLSFSQNVSTQYSIGILAFASTAEMLGAQAFRLIAVSLPVVFYSISHLSIHRRRMIVYIFFAYNILQFTYWLNV